MLDFTYLYYFCLDLVFFYIHIHSSCSFACFIRASQLMVIAILLCPAVSLLFAVILGKLSSRAWTAIITLKLGLNILNTFPPLQSFEKDLICDSEH